MCSGCFGSNTISGSFATSGGAGCAAPEEVDVSADDYDDNDTRESFPCAAGRFSIEISSEMDDLWLHVILVDPRSAPSDRLLAEVDLQLTDVNGDRDVGLVAFDRSAGF